MFTCEAYILHALGSFFKHSSLVDISQKIFQHNRTNFENLSTIETFLKISARLNDFKNLSTFEPFLSLTKVGVGAPALVWSKGWRSNRLRRFHLRVRSGNQAIKTDETLDRRVSQVHRQFGATSISD